MSDTNKKISVGKIIFSLLMGVTLIFTLSACSSEPVSAEEYQENDWIIEADPNDEFSFEVDINFTENEVIMESQIGKIIYDYEIDKDKIILTNKADGRIETYKVKKEENNKVKWTLSNEDSEVKSEVILTKLN